MNNFSHVESRRYHSLPHVVVKFVTIRAGLISLARLVFSLFRGPQTGSSQDVVLLLASCGENDNDDRLDKTRLDIMRFFSSSRRFS
jgi:hypothetical protein